MVDALRVRAFCYCMAAAVFLVVPLTAHANRTAATAHLCEAALLASARTHAVPPNVLRAITLTETGRTRDGKHIPWPWTVNMEGEGRWFDTKNEARAYVAEYFGRGARSFDVGCFQINYRWHGEAFRSIDDMFDPRKNADYAARFLKSLHAEFGNWERAAGAYHSRTPKYANAYTKRFRTILASLGDQPESEIERATMQPMHVVNGTRDRLNRYPLLQGLVGQRDPSALIAGTGAASLGSLVRISVD